MEVREGLEVIARLASAAPRKEARAPEGSAAGDETRRAGIRDPSIRMLAFDYRNQAGEEPNSRRKIPFSVTSSQHG